MFDSYHNRVVSFSKNWEFTFSLFFISRSHSKMFSLSPKAPTVSTLSGNVPMAASIFG